MWLPKYRCHGNIKSREQSPLIPNNPWLKSQNLVVYLILKIVWMFQVIICHLIYRNLDRFESMTWPDNSRIINKSTSLFISPLMHLVGDFPRGEITNPLCILSVADLFCKINTGLWLTHRTSKILSVNYCLLLTPSAQAKQPSACL